MELEKRIELIKSLLHLAKMEEFNEVKPETKTERLGKCIWIDLDGNKRCNNSWTERQSKQVLGKFIP